MLSLHGNGSRELLGSIAQDGADSNRMSARDTPKTVAQAIAGALWVV